MWVRIRLLNGEQGGGCTEACLSGWGQIWAVGTFSARPQGGGWSKKCILGLKGAKCHRERDSTGHQEAQDQGELELGSRQATPSAGMGREGCGEFVKTLYVSGHTETQGNWSRLHGRREGGHWPHLARLSGDITSFPDNNFSALPKREESESLVLFVKPAYGFYYRKQLLVASI